MPRYSINVPTISERDSLKKLYLKQVLPINKISKVTGYSPRQVYYRLYLHGVTNSPKQKSKINPKYCSSCGVHLQWLHQHIRKING